MSGKGQIFSGKNRKRRVRRRRRRHDEIPEASRPVKPGELKESELLQLQRTYGNAYVQRLLAEREEKGQGVNPPKDKPIPDDVRGKMEEAFDADFSDVRIQEDDGLKQSDTLAVTSGQDIHFAPGHYDPSTQEGQELLGHELAHVVQQRRGRPSEVMADTTKTQHAALEGEAERAGAGAAQGRAVQVAGASAGTQARRTGDAAKPDPRIRPTEFKLGKQLIELSREQFEMFKSDYLAQATESGEPDAQLKVNLQKAEDFLEEMMVVIVEAWDKWRQQSYFHGLKVEGQTATGAQGCLYGPDLLELMKDKGLPARGNMATNYAEAISQGLSENWKLWQDNVTVPGLSLYPDFLNYNGADAPPTPNVPTPLLRFESKERRMLTPEILMETFEKYYEGENPTAQGVFSNIAESFSQIFFIWLKTHLVQRIMGSGHVSGHSEQNKSGPVVGKADQDPPAMAL